jgi:hypothetical protein
MQAFDDQNFSKNQIRKIQKSVYITQAFLVWYQKFPDGCLNKAGEE